MSTIEYILITNALISGICLIKILNLITERDSAREERDHWFNKYEYNLSVPFEQHLKDNEK